MPNWTPVTPTGWRRLHSKYRYHTAGIRVALWEIRLFGLREWLRRRKQGQ